MSTLLNKPQQQAVQTTKGRVLVLAGAGSGKTRVITYRIAHLLRTGVKPENILGLTFTNKAAKEMQQRIAKLINPALAKKVTLSTFHSFCVKILRKHIAKLGYTKAFSIYDEKDNLRILKQIVEEYDDKTLPHPQDLLSLFSDFKNKGMHYNELIDDTDKKKEKNLQEIFERYDNSLKSYNALDFDSILSLTAKLLNTHKEVAEEYQNLYQYIMIDEYQDTNNIQYQIAEAISKSHNNLFVVGDDDQSIYGWRGADVKHILEFKADSFIKLEENYRSYPTILHAANHVISHNKTRHQKRLFSSKKEDQKIHLFNAPKDVDEAQGVIDRMIKLKEKGYKWEDMAILYRSNALS
ncbi:MAG TPA: UvrD-helicase domain-containing protein, partial [Chlamydiales bacterium]|nr:UvrD-helicase domain-containing protein [Chlamydiales bacterium]